MVLRQRLSIRANSPAPAGQTYGKTSKRWIDSYGRLEKEAVLVNGAEQYYTRREFPTNGVQSKTYSTIIDTNISTNPGPDSADEVYSESWSDGARRMRMSRTEHPGSTGGWTASQVEYDLLGRVKRQSVPTEVSVSGSTWTPSGDDTTRGWLWTYQKYDWKGRVVRKINTDGADSSTPNDSDVLISYEGCGCAGGQVTTIESERVPIPNTSNYARRKQKIYEDILGRGYKTEIFEWDGTTVYSTVTSTYNGRDQVVLTREYSGTTSSEVFQDTTATFDGFGRLASSHKPEQRDNSNNLKYTTYTYNPDDSISTVTDARGATTQLTYNSRGLVEAKSYTVPSESNIDDPADVSFAYDNVGNRTQMTDGLGQVDYEYDSLSRMTAETRDFNDDLPNAPITGSKFKLEYTYTLSGGLRSYTDAYGKTINYANDRTGRITAVTGASIAGNYDYADNPHYRAWGALTHLDYGNGTEMNVGGFNNKLQATTFEVKKGTTSIINKSYDYYTDGSLKSETDNNNAKFDRLYKYDHRSRMTDAKSAAEARGSTDTAVNIPFRNAIQYDAFDHQTQLVTKHFTRSDTIDPSYQNNREQYGTYDLDGRMEIDGWMQQKVYKYNAAGQLGNSIYQSCGEPCTTDVETLKYDGDGLLVKVQTSHTVDENEPIVESTYKIRSSAMGGEEIVSAESFGNRIVTYVRAAGTTIATHSSVISWMHKDLNMNSMRSTREDGTLIEQEGGSNLGKHELDPAGNSVGFTDPYTVSYPDPFPYFFQPFESFGSLVNGQFQSYSVDGIQVPRSYLLVQTEFTFGGIFGLVEHQSRMSYFEWLRNMTTPDGPDLPGPDKILGTNDDTIQVGSSTGWYRKDGSWALNMSLVPFDDGGKWEKIFTGGGDPPPSSQTECEIKIARAFGDEGAYFSDPHDGDAVDLTTGMSPIGNANAAKQSSGDNHLYGSATDPDARTAFYLPAGVTANLVNLNPNPRAKIPQYMGRIRNGDSYFIIQFPELNQSLIVYHGINVGLGDPDATGRRKVAEMGDGGGGESNFRSSDPSKRPSTVWRKSYHYHLEMMNGLLKSFPAKKPWASFDTLCASLK